LLSDTHIYIRQFLYLDHFVC